MDEIRNCENLYCEKVTIPAGAAEAPPFSTEGRALVGIQMPAAWTAAKIGFEASVDAKTFQTAKDNTGALVESAAAASVFIPFPQDSAIFAPYLKVKSTAPAGTGVAENQAADRVLVLIFRRLFGGG